MVLENTCFLLFLCLYTTIYSQDVFVDINAAPGGDGISWGTAFTDIEQTTSINAIGYILSIGTTAGGTDVINALDVGNVTTFNLPNDLPENTKIFIPVTPYNFLGVWCIEEQFRTRPRFKAGFKIPEFFTPNGDGFQDEWFVTDPDNSIT